MHMHTDIRALHHRAVSNTVTLVNSVTVADLGAATPCAHWTLADLLTHMTAQHRGFAAAARGLGDDPAVWRAEAVRDAIATNPGTTYADAARDVLTAFADNAVLDAPFALAEFGPHAVFPGAVAIGFHFVDYVVHGWDVAQSLGVAYALPDEVIDAVEPLALAVPDGDGRDGEESPFARAVTGASATKLDRVLRHLGRNPEWAQQRCASAP